MRNDIFGLGIIKKVKKTAEPTGTFLKRKLLSKEKIDKIYSKKLSSVFVMWKYTLLVLYENMWQDDKKSATSENYFNLFSILN